MQRGLFAPGLPPQSLTSPGADEQRAEYRASKVARKDLDDEDGAGNGDQKEGNGRARTVESLDETLREETQRAQLVEDSEIPATQPPPAEDEV